MNLLMLLGIFLTLKNSHAEAEISLQKYFKQCFDTKQKKIPISGLSINCRTMVYVHM